MNTKSEQSKTHVATVDYDPKLDEHVLVFGEDILEEMGWKEGDTLEWIDNNDGSWTIVKVRDNKGEDE